MSSFKISDHDLLTQVIRNSLNTKPTKGVLQGVRRITKGQPGKHIIFFPSLKNNALMGCESRLEAANCIHLEFDSSVLNYRTQPFTIDLGKNQSYTPDTIHIDQLGNLVIREVKFSGELKDKNLRDRLNRLKIIFSNLSATFEEHTEETLQLPPRINNYKYLYRCSHLRFDKMLIDLAIGILEELSPDCTLKELRKHCVLKGLPPLIADKLLFLGHASYDENQELNADSLIWNNGGLQ